MAENDYLIISGATEGSEYVNCLEQQALAFAGFNYRPFIVKCRGSWNENTKIKPEVIRKAFDYCDEVLWVDADSLLNPPPHKPNEEFDIGIFDNIHPYHHCRISSTFIYFRNTPGTKQFLELWEQFMITVDRDHIALMQTIKTASSKPVMFASIDQKSTEVNITNITHWIKGRDTINALLPERGMYGS